MYRGVWSQDALLIVFIKILNFDILQLCALLLLAAAVPLFCNYWKVAEDSALQPRFIANERLIPAHSNSFSTPSTLPDAFYDMLCDVVLGGSRGGLAEAHGTKTEIELKIAQDDELS